ncbi:hypothetical protein QNE90_004888 [Vibrio alginolyticus]|nr:hypothetical protein [Vibrio alginolyticus]ELB2846142.1 hypothetical protein [Vibrio alginolyticus]ELB2865200.1 hypothetical protein [Vibrio alginolyticus]ELU8569424.1 hypothetical protein [Vibrio alginolyticus]
MKACFLMLNIENIPDKHFKMIRYVGLIENRRTGEMFPKVYDALGIAPKDAPEMTGYVDMLKGYVKVDPFECILCGHRLTCLRLYNPKITVPEPNAYFHPSRSPNNAVNTQPKEHNEI